MCVSTPDTGGNDSGDAGSDATDAAQDAADADVPDTEGDVPGDVPDTENDAADAPDTVDVPDAADATDSADSSDATDVAEDTSPADPCTGADLCIESRFTLTYNEEVISGIPSSNTFVPLIGIEVQLRSGCDIVSTSSRGNYFELVAGLIVEFRCTVTDAAALAGSSRELVDTIVSAQVGRDLIISFADSEFWTLGRMAGVYYPVADYEGFTLEWTGFDLELLGADGNPEFTPFEAQTSPFFARRFVDGEMADIATGTSTLSLTRQPLD